MRGRYWHERQTPPEAGIDSPPENRVVYASKLGDTIVGWIRARRSPMGWLVLEQM